MPKYAVKQEVGVGWYDTDVCYYPEFFEDHPDYTGAPEVYVEMTDEEWEGRMDGFHDIIDGKLVKTDHPGPDETMLREQVTAKRNWLLAKSDWVDLPNSPVKNKDAWLSYRQQLRDMTENAGFPHVAFPTAPV